MRFSEGGAAHPAGAIKRPENFKKQENLRCGCGSLLARIIKKGIELKCRRCKGKTLIPLSGIAGDVKKMWAEVSKGE